MEELRKELEDFFVDVKDDTALSNRKDFVIVYSLSLVS